MEVASIVGYVSPLFHSRHQWEDSSKNDCGATEVMPYITRTHAGSMLHRIIYRMSESK